MIERGSLKLRVKSILDPGIERSPAATPGVLIGWLAILALAIPLAGIGFFEQTESAGTILFEKPNRAENILQTSNESVPEKSEIASQNSPSAKPAERIEKRTAVKTSTVSAAVVTRKRELIAVNESEQENFSSGINEARRNLTTDSNPLFPPKTENNLSSMAKTLSSEKSKPDSSTADAQSTGGETHKTVRRIFENIRQGFKNGKKPINIFDP